MSNIPTPEEFAKAIIDWRISQLAGRADVPLIETERDIVNRVRIRDAQVRAEAIEEAAKIALDFMRENHERRISVARADAITKRLRALAVPK